MSTVVDMRAPTSTTLESIYVVRGDVSADAVTRSLQALVATQHHTIRRGRLTVFDTVDGRIRRAGARLTRRAGRDSDSVTWRRPGRGTNLTLRVTGPVSFAWDLPHGPLQRALAPVVGVRRLMAQFETETTGSLLDVLDPRNKTIARIRVESGHARLPLPGHAWQPLPSLITLSGLRGYEDMYHSLLPLIESRPGVESCREGFDTEALRQLGALPPILSAPGTDLPPTVLAEIGARYIHKGLLRILLANEPGLRANIDTEFLHDFRVAVRRTRSLLGQIKRIFPPEALVHFSTEFSWLGRLTTSARDLDVLVLSLRAEADQIQPDDMQALTAFLGDAQQREHQKLVAELDSERYRKLLTEWATFLERSAPLHADAPNAKRQLTDIVAQRAWRLSRRIGSRIETIDLNTPPQQLHEVRLAAKKLRYLIDVTPTFYDPVDLERILSALKRMQRVLGDFNDAQVQEQRLTECVRVLAAADGPPGTLRALDHLADQCRLRRERLRGLVTDGLVKFRSPSTRSACRRAFKRARPAEHAT